MRVFCQKVSIACKHQQKRCARHFGVQHIRRMRDMNAACGSGGGVDRIIAHPVAADHFQIGHRLHIGGQNPIMTIRGDVRNFITMLCQPGDWICDIRQCVDGEFLRKAMQHLFSCAADQQKIRHAHASSTTL